jgi:3-methyladenine DNA glycosylase/8-oxoguanine DNA glycosylase
MSISDSTLEALVASILAVNNWPLEKTWNLLPQLRARQLLNVNAAAAFDQGEMTVRLAEAGYDRGAVLTPMIADRISALMRAVQDGSLTDFESLLGRRDKKAAVECLCRVKGVGPKVAENVWMLLVED